MTVTIIMPTPAERRSIAGLAKAICNRSPSEIERTIAKNLALDRKAYAARGIPADAIDAHCKRWEAAFRAAILRAKFGPRPSRDGGRPA